MHVISPENIQSLKGTIELTFVPCFIVDLFIYKLGFESRLRISLIVPHLNKMTFEGRRSDKSK